MRTPARAAARCHRCAAAAVLVCLAACTVLEPCAAAAVRPLPPHHGAASEFDQGRSGRKLSESTTAPPPRPASRSARTNATGQVSVASVLTDTELPDGRAVHLSDVYYRVIGTEVDPITPDLIHDLGLAATSLYGLFNIVSTVVVMPARSAPTVQYELLAQEPPPPLAPPPARGATANRRLLQAAVLSSGPSGSPATPPALPLIDSTPANLPVDYAAVVLKVQTYVTRATYLTRISQQQLFSQHLGLEGSMQAFGYMVEFVPEYTIVPESGLALLLRLPASVTQYPQIDLEAVFRFSGRDAVPVTVAAQTALLAHVADQVPPLISVNATGISTAPDGASAELTLLFIVSADAQQLTATDLRQLLEPNLAQTLAAVGVPGNVSLVVVRNGTDPFSQIKREIAAGCCKTIVTVAQPGYAAPSPGGGSGLSGGAIAGIVVGAVAAVLFVVAAAALLWRRRRRRAKQLAGSAGGHGKLSGAELQDQKLQGWLIPHEQIAVCRHEDGHLWLLGEGACGKVYKALRGGVQDVAVKMLVTDTDNETVAKFLEEVGILKSLNYDRNIVQFYGACIQPGQAPMLVTEYMEGGDLCSAIERDAHGKLKWYSEGHAIALDIARGLFFLHSHGVCHGDVKTRNVLLTRSHTAKMSDVGLSQIIDAAGDGSSATAWTFAYAAPEVILGKPMGLESDIFSFGVVLHELVSGIVPVTRGNLPEPVVGDDCPQDISELIHACTAAEPEARPTAKQVFAALQRSCELHVPHYRLTLAAAAAANAAANRSSIGGGGGSSSESRLQKSGGSLGEKGPKSGAGVLPDGVVTDGIGKHSASSIDMGLAPSPLVLQQLSRSTAAPAAHSSTPAGAPVAPAASAAAAVQDAQQLLAATAPPEGGLQPATAAAPAAAHQLIFGGPGMSPGPSMEYSAETLAAVLQSAAAVAAPRHGCLSPAAPGGSDDSRAGGSGSAPYSDDASHTQPAAQPAEQLQLPSSRQPSYSGASMYSVFE